MTPAMEEKKSAPCGLCGAPSTFSFPKDGFNYYRCSSCYFVFVFPTPADTSTVYDKDYFCGGAGGFGYVDYDADKAAMKSAFEEYLEIMERALGKPGKLLDVGAASGYFLGLARDRGWSVEGIEISAFGAELARKKGIATHTGTLLSYPGTPENFDAVSLLDVLEHVQNPDAEVKKAASLLKKGGVVVVNTPDTGSLIARVLGTKWHQYIPPEHIAMFNSKNLTTLLEKNGFRVEKVARIGKKFTIQYVLEILERHVRIPGAGALLKVVKSSPLGKLSVSINLFDNIFVSAKKI